MFNLLSKLKTLISADHLHMTINQTITVTLSMLLLVGCSGGGPDDRGEVRGTVSLDGQPIEKGSIVFEPTDGNSGPMSGATIQNGAYHVPAKKGPAVGANRIEIRATKKTGRKVPARPPLTGEEDEIVQFIPARYNEESTLIEEINPGENVIDFDLDSS